MEGRGGVEGRRVEWRGGGGVEGRRVEWRGGVELRGGGWNGGEGWS